MNPKTLRTTQIVVGLMAWLTIAIQLARGQTNFTKLKSFGIVSNGVGFVYPDGSIPMSSLAADADGILYGITESGGATNAGTVFRIRKDGTDFAQLNNFFITNGGYPMAALLLSTNGILFGTTSSGGTHNLGTIFSLSRDGSAFSVFHNFLGGGDGMSPKAALIEASDGALYGVTPNGNGTAQGTIFKISKDGSGYSVIFAFPSFATGVQPKGRLLEGSNGLLYGTTSAGGSPGAGVVFAIAKDGTGYTILHNFKGSDGGIPSAGLIEASDGDLYGTTYSGGSANAGTVFKINKDGSGFAIIRNFSGTGGDAGNLMNELIESSDGFLYSSSRAGGAGYGVIFKMNKDGSGYTILRSFLGPQVDGGTPSPLLQLSAGVFCGTDSIGAGDAGSVFALTSTPLAPRILSQSLSGTTNLLQLALSTDTSYDIENSTNLAFWEVLATVVSETDGNLSFSDTNAPQPTAFYRLRQH